MNEQTYLESVVKPLLSKPEDLEIAHQVDEKGILLTIRANSVDMGRVIGKGGSTANAIRVLVRQYGALNQQHISVKINDPVGYEKPSYPTDKEMLS